ncbi:nose resistant to fluoxetine protein 6-like, partial [Tropilaelaps mercedesae]
ILSWRVWTFLSRLTYCILFSHAYVVLYSNGVARSPFFFSYDYLFYLALHHTVFAIFVSFVLSLLVERPLVELLKLCSRTTLENHDGLETHQPEPTLAPILIAARKPKRQSSDASNKETSFDLKLPSL